MSRVLGLVALSLLSGCGIKGNLDRPDPLWNSEEAIRADCEEDIANNREPDARCERYQTAVPTTP